ncbi:MAG TPA: ABC transporter substrate-binding protein [Erysipelothrix sp.]
MKNKLFKVLTVFLVLLLVVGCGQKGKDGGKDDEVVTLLMYQVGEEPDNFDKIMERVNEIAEEEIGARVDFKYIGWGDWGQKMPIIISSGEYYDMALAVNYTSNAQKGAFVALDDLIKEYAADYFAELDDAYITGNLVDGKLYGFPVNGNVFAQQMFTFNYPVLEKYGLEDQIEGVKTYADLEPILEAVKEQDKEIAGFAVGQGYKATLGNFDYVIGGMPFAVDIDGDHNKIVNAYETPQAMERLKEVHGLYKKGLIPQDAATSQTSYGHGEDTWVVRMETQGPQDFGDKLLTTVAQRKLVSVPVSKPIKSTAQAQMANFVISSNSKHPEKAFQFLTLMNTNAEVLNTMIHGVKGEDWEMDGTDRVKKLTPGNHMSPWNTANNNLVYQEADVTDEMIAERDKAMAEAVASPILGFTFVEDDVKTEIANVKNVLSQYEDGLNTGTLDPEETLPKFIEELNTAGMQKVLEEMQSQFDTWKAAQ